MNILMWIGTAAMGVMGSSLPNPELTPGDVNPAVTQETISTTICSAGWASSVRPPVAYTQRMKRVSIAQYGYADHVMQDYEFDHLIPLELGGNPTSMKNLWAEPLLAVDGWRATDKDLLENTLRSMVCAGKVSLDAARAAIAGNWEDAYTTYVTEGSR